MSRMKTFGKYVLWIVLFYIFSNILIFLGLNSTYKNIDIKGTIPEQIKVDVAEATLVNGRIEGSILNSEDISNKYIKFNFYSDTGNLAGFKYIKVSDCKDNNFEFYFRLNYIESYSVELVDEANDMEKYENCFSLEEYRKYKIVYWFVLLMFI